MRVNKEGVIIGYTHKEYCLDCKRISLPKRALKFGGSFTADLGWIALEPKEKIEVEEGNPVFYMKDGCLIDRTTKTLVLAEIGATMPRDGSIEHIGNNAFLRHSEFYGSLIIPDGVKTIGEKAFSGCTGIVGLVIPESIEEIAPYAFQGCDKLERIAVKNGNPKYRAEGNCVIETTTNRLVLGCKASKIPEGVTAIGEGAFFEIETLESIVVPNSVKLIERYAFFSCASLKQITLSETLESIELAVFGYCYALENVRIPASVTSIRVGAFVHCHSLKEIKLPANIEEIGWEVFSRCAMKKIVIPKNVKKIHPNAFRGCMSLESVVFEDPSGWIYNGRQLKEEDLRDSATAAEFLKDKYSSCRWEKKA